MNPKISLSSRRRSWRGYSGRRGTTRRTVSKLSQPRGRLPLEPPADRYTVDPRTVRLTLADGNEEYSAGTHYVKTGPMTGRYEPQMLEFGAIVRGEMGNPYSLDHELLVQESLLAAAGYAGGS